MFGNREWYNVLKMRTLHVISLQFPMIFDTAYTLYFVDVLDNRLRSTTPGVPPPPPKKKKKKKKRAERSFSLLWYLKI